ncbi:MAG: hypothetical protein KF725_06635 [Cyclobacteriaceae bacterium]|nr:hypothetical protein [Cyclobacteriaceae bacterium]UYN88395.1 MAG: hypothetical protein KIT51_09175 [Cyclobacteriaceae bacterium]
MNPAMKFLMIFNLTAGVVYGQSFDGAWKLISQNGKPVADECIKIYSEKYFMFALYDKEGKFIKAGGGNYSTDKKNYTEVLDFYTTDSTKVRQPVTYSYSLKKGELTIEAPMHGMVLKETWRKVDVVALPLSGAWRFGARVDDNGVAGERRGGISPRQTIKILSGNHFQWAAFNYETKQFMGTGGGTYKLEDGKYTETISFFSRDNSRAGMSLTFDCRLEGTDWYHKGKGTTGNPVSEVWERIK